MAEACLANARGPDERDEVPARKRLAEVGELFVTAEERGDLAGQVAPRVSPAIASRAEAVEGSRGDGSQAAIGSADKTGVARGGGPVWAAQFVQDAVDVPFGGADGDHQPLGDSGGWKAGGDEREHLALARGELSAGRIGSRTAGARPSTTSPPPGEVCRTRLSSIGETVRKITRSTTV